MYRLFFNLPLKKASQILCSTIMFYEQGYWMLISLKFLEGKWEWPVKKGTERPPLFFSFDLKVL